MPQSLVILAQKDQQQVEFNGTAAASLLEAVNLPVAFWCATLWRRGVGYSFMDCPVCKNAMITLELADVEIDHCITCGGTWLDAGELELLVGNSETAQQFLSSFQIDATAAELPRTCPICDKKMQKILASDSKDRLLLDKCTRGHGLWFDKAELQNVLNRAKLDKDNKILTILTDMFGHAQPNKT